jgi:hypothetical protein
LAGGPFFVDRQRLGEIQKIILESLDSTERAEYIKGVEQRGTKHGETTMKAGPRKTAAEKKLVEEYGATLEKREDKWGETKSGWWMDGVWLAGPHDPDDALRGIEGN